jgi:hypothetical protein
MARETTDHSIDRKFLETALPPDRGAFDIEDSFQCYAFMWLQFECCACGRTEMFEDADYPADVSLRGSIWQLPAEAVARREGHHDISDFHPTKRSTECQPSRIS